MKGRIHSLFHQRRRILQGAALSLAFVGAAWAGSGAPPAPATTVYLVRHAEKEAAGADPALTVAGKQRAEELSHVLADAGIEAIYVTKATRSGQTGAPLAARLGIAVRVYDRDKAKELADNLFDKHPNGRVLVVAHSDTIKDIAAALGVAGLSTLAEDAYDRFLVIHRVGNVATLDRLRYGAATP